MLRTRWPRTSHANGVLCVATLGIRLGNTSWPRLSNMVDVVGGDVMGATGVSNGNNVTPSTGVLTLDYQALALVPFLFNGKTSSTLQVRQGVPLYLNLAIGTGEGTPSMSDTQLFSIYGVMTIAQAIINSAKTWNLGTQSGIAVIGDSGSLSNGTGAGWQPGNGNSSTYSAGTLTIVARMDGIFPKDTMITELGLFLDTVEYVGARQTAAQQAGLLLVHTVLDTPIKVPENGTLYIEWYIEV